MQTMVETFEAAKRQTDAASHVLLLTDERSDGDTFGSSLAFAEHLRAEGKKVTHVAGAHVLEMLQFLPGIETVTEDRSVMHDATIDLAIVFDSSREAHVQGLLDHLPKEVPLLVFDHHASNTNFGHVNVVHPVLSSTCEVVYEYFLHHGVEITRTMAKCLMTGIMTDTRMLTNPVTNPDAVQRAGELLTQGGSINVVVDNVLKQMRVEQLQLWGRIFDRAVRVPEHNMAVFWVTQKDHDQTGPTGEDIPEVMDYFQATLEIDLVMFLKERDDGMVKVSMRSLDKDASKIARFFGGGGHPGACGFSVKGRVRKDANRVKVV